MSQPLNPESQIPDLEPQLEAAVWAALSEPIDADAVARVKARALMLASQSAGSAATQPAEIPAFLDTPANHSQNQTLATPRTIALLPRSLLVKCLSTAAAVLVLVGASFLLQSPPSAFGQAIQQLRTAKAYSYVSRISTSTSDKPIETKVTVAEDGRQRSEMAGEVISIMDASARLRLTLMTQGKRAIVHTPIEQPKVDMPNGQLKWLEDLKSHSGRPDGQLGKKVLNGRNVEGFVAKQGLNSYTVWIDTKTKELVQVEHEMPVKGSSITNVVMSDFRFHETFDDSLFSFEAPQGFQVQIQAAPPKVAGGEASIVEALRRFTKRSDGKFPKSITEWGEWAVQFSAGSKDGKPSPEATETMAHLGSILPFLVAKSKDDYQYLGDGKLLTDPKCIVFWHRVDDVKFRAIYNDLTVADVEKKDLP